MLIYICWCSRTVSNECSELPSVTSVFSFVAIVGRSVNVSIYLQANNSLFLLLERVMSQVSAAAQSCGHVHKSAARKKVTPALEETSDRSHFGICGQMRVTTVLGEIRIEDLCVGDHLKTRSGRFSAIKQIKVTNVDSHLTMRHPEALPVMIPQGALGNDLPKRDIMVSPDQLVAEQTEDDASQKVRARDLTNSVRILGKFAEASSYYEIRLESEDDICCEGVWVKTGAAQ